MSRRFLAALVASAAAFAFPALAGLHLGWMDELVAESPWLVAHPLLIAALLASRSMPAEVRGSLRAAWFRHSVAIAALAAALLAALVLLPAAASEPLAFLRSGFAGAAAVAYYLAASCSLILGALLQRAWAARAEADALLAIPQRNP
jgi:hypothetical protein